MPHFPFPLAGVAIVGHDKDAALREVISVQW
jgi:hypothetical protein